MIKVLGLNHKESGCGYHRILLPLGFMNGIKGHVTNVITEEKAAEDEWQMILYNRKSLYDGNWEEFKRITGFKVVMDLDDYWKLPPNHINFQFYDDVAKIIENNMRQADMVTVTNEALAEKVRPYNSNVHIFPNALPYGQNQFIEDKRECDRVRIFWCGGATHEHDLRLLRNPIQRLKVHKDKIKMVIGGYTDTDETSKIIWDRMFSCFTAGGQLPYMKMHGTSPNSYMQFYEHADIMLVPLEDSEWHACKSNLKMLEAACKRVPCIVSDVAPYNVDKEAPVLWVKSQKDWFEHLNYLILNPDARIELGNKLYEWAKEKYNLTEINERRYSAFSSLCEA